MSIKDVWSKPLTQTGVATALCAVSGSLATEPDSVWFRALDKPRWQPPGWLFPIVWTGLYTSVALTAAKVIEAHEAEGDEQSATRYRAALLVNLALNQGWSWVFFKAHRLRPATAVAALLAASSVDLARRARATGTGKALALAPYAAWCSFATILTREISRRNPS